MREGFQILHGLDVPCAEPGWFCCNPRSENKADQHNEEYGSVHLKKLGLKKKNKKITAVHWDAKKIIHRCSSFPTYLLKAIVLITIGTVPAVPVPVGHHRVLITEPAVHVCMGRLLSVRNRWSSCIIQHDTVNQSRWCISEAQMFPAVGSRQHIDSCTSGGSESIAIIYTWRSVRSCVHFKRIKNQSLGSIWFEVLSMQNFGNFGIDWKQSRCRHL